MASRSAVSPSSSGSSAAATAAEDAAPPLLTNWQLIRWMFRFLRPVKWMMLVVCLYLALGLAVEVLAVHQTARAVDQIALIQFSEIATRDGFFAWVVGGDPHARRLREVVIALGGLVVLLVILRYLREVANTKTSMQMVYYLREAIYDKLQHVGFGFHDRVSTGQIINRSLTDLQNVRQFVQSSVLVTLEIVLSVAFYIVLLLTRSPWVAALALAPVPIWVWYIMRFSRRIQPVQRAVMEAADNNVSIVTENIAGVHVVKAFATEPHEIDKYNRNCDTFFGRVIHRIRLFANFTPVIRAIASASHLTLFLTAGILIIKGRLNAGDILALGAAMGAILTRLQQVSTINDQYQAAIVSARRLHEVLDAQPTVEETRQSRPLPAEAAGHVTFEDVTFGYDPAKPVLEDVSFDVPAGSVVAIVGPTGAGKTTLVNLLARFYDPQGGRILLDGIDIRELNLSSLRARVAFVFQETYLFSDTVEGNIAYGRPGTRGGAVEAASRLAQAHEFVETLPAGYETVLGERGASLSGGQRQRLAIARAILSDPLILVLDDATAAVDPETEDLIRRGMRLAMHGRTVFIIAHRISTVKQADMVIVLENGRVTQTGKHADLMEQSGYYRQIAAVQLAGEGVEAAEEEILSHMDRMGRGRVRTPAGAAAADAMAEGGADV